MNMDTLGSFGAGEASGIEGIRLCPIVGVSIVTNHINNKFCLHMCQ